MSAGDLGSIPGKALKPMGEEHAHYPSRVWLENPCFERGTDVPDDELLNVRRAAAELGLPRRPFTACSMTESLPVSNSHLAHHGAFDLTDARLARFNGEAGEDFLPMQEAMRVLKVSRQTVLQRVKRNELEAVHVVRGQQKGRGSKC